MFPEVPALLSSAGDVCVCDGSSLGHSKEEELGPPGRAGLVPSKPRVLSSHPCLVHEVQSS